MEVRSNESVEKHFPRRETVLLNFDKKDSQIARDWLNSDHKDIFDDED